MSETNESKYLTDEIKKEIEEKIKSGEAEDNVIEWIKSKKLPKLRLEVIKNIHNGIKAAIKSRERAEVINKEKTIGDIEKREQEFYTKVFDNIEEIERLKERAIEKIREKIDKIKPRDLRDLSIVQAIGMRELREFKIKRAGRLSHLSEEQLQTLKLEILKSIKQMREYKVKNSEKIINAEYEIIKKEGKDEAKEEKVEKVCGDTVEQGVEMVQETTTGEAQQ